MVNFIRFTRENRFALAGLFLGALLPLFVFGLLSERIQATGGL